MEGMVAPAATIPAAPALFVEAVVKAESTPANTGAGVAVSPVALAWAAMAGRTEFSAATAAVATAGACGGEVAAIVGAAAGVAVVAEAGVEPSSSAGR